MNVFRVLILQKVRSIDEWIVESIKNNNLKANKTIESFLRDVLLLNF